jgi:2-hydroxychromene-2-carboxylate isomerase
MKQGNSDTEVKMYSDFKSPYAYIAFDLGIA